MKLFLKRTFIFGSVLLLIFAINGTINFLILNNGSPKIEDKKVLILGDSYTEAAINPKYFNSAQNISQGAEPYIITFYKLRKILKTSRPDTVIIGFSFHNIASFNDIKFNDERWSGEMIKRSLPLSDYRELSSTVNFDRTKYLMSYFRRMFLIPNLKMHESYIGDYDMNDQNDLKNLEQTIDRHYQDDNISRTSIQFLDSIVDLCKEENLELVLVSTPVHRLYLNKVPIEVRDNLYKLTERYESRGIRFLDYSAQSIVDSNFKNYDHLNSKGAKEFSKRLNRDLKSG